MHSFKIIFFLFVPLLVSSQTKLIVQGDVVNVRKLADVNSEIVVKVKRFDALVGIEKANQATINGITDYWYKVQTPSGKLGYVFGHFTSWKKEGQITSIMTLNDVMFGDCFHIVFDEIDFGDGWNDLGKFDDIEEDAYNDEKVYVGMKFRVTYNTLYSKKSLGCSPEQPEELIETETIVNLEKVD